jgi:hypothetical protein
MGVPFPRHYVVVLGESSLQYTASVAKPVDETLASPYDHAPPFVTFTRDPR